MAPEVEGSAGGANRTRELLRERISYRDPIIQTILSPPPLTGLGYSRRDIRSTGTHPLNAQVTEALLNSLAMSRRMVGRAGFEPATFDSNE
jgi:hypothetical protein